jgi:hypothetical protein
MKIDTKTSAVALLASDGAFDLFEDAVYQNVNKQGKGTPMSCIRLDQI